MHADLTACLLLLDVPLVGQVAVICQRIRGTLLLDSMRIQCRCDRCAHLPVERRTYTPTQFEAHAGAGNAKKWKASVRIEPGAVRECPAGATPMTVGRWLEARGLDTRPPRSAAGVGTGMVCCDASRVWRNAAI